MSTLKLLRYVCELYIVGALLELLYLYSDLLSLTVRGCLYVRLLHLAKYLHGCHGEALIMAVKLANWVLTRDKHA